MARYILDTHTLLWFLENNPRLPENIRENIEYIQYEFYISHLSLIEIDNLRKLGKISYNLSLEDTLNKLQESYIEVHFDSMKDLKVLDNLEMKTINAKTHGDYIDRMLIATAIANHYIMISADSKFPHYKQSGLSLLEI